MKSLNKFQLRNFEMIEQKREKNKQSNRKRLYLKNEFDFSSKKRAFLGHAERCEDEIWELWTEKERGTHR